MQRRNPPSAIGGLRYFARFDGDPKHSTYYGFSLRHGQTFQIMTARQVGVPQSIRPSAENRVGLWAADLAFLNHA